MRALVFRGPADLCVADFPDPVPGPDEVLLRITATGICGSDLHGYTGENGRRHAGQIMGHETVGRIVGVGSAVPEDRNLRPGRVATVNPVIGCGHCTACAAGDEHRCVRRRVIGVDPTLRSAFAELMTAPAGNVILLPDDVPEEYGALVEPLAVGYHAAVRGAITPQDRVLVVGGGPIGQACALAARRLGASRIAVSDLSPHRRALLGKLALATIDPADGAVGERVRALLDGPADVVLDAVGTGASLADAFAGSAFGARIVLVGMNAPEITLQAYEISTQERSITGSFCYPSAEFRQTADWVATGPPELAHLIEGRTPLAGGPDAFAGLASGELTASKVLVLCQS
ncbi:MAG TPA: alcohol dehydrogenase catalytic domain-containing protein [Micromonosporaceae bacterium]|nr:alcohol dehydrogenase catalytic domain-containing protein [Micromonosporaceae bacterium]